MRNRPKSLTADQAALFIEHLKKSTTTKCSRLKSIRNTTMALLMLDAGLRCGEVAALNYDDLFFNREPVTNLNIDKRIAKKSAIRTVPVSKRIYYQLILMLNSWFLPPLPPEGSAVFLCSAGGKRISPRQIQRIFERAGLDSIGERINPHMLRHTFASMLMRKTNIRVVQTLLGHKSLSSTQIYTHPDAEDLRTAIQALPE